MRRYLTPFAGLVTLMILAGCAGTTQQTPPAMRTPSGTQIGQLPQFTPLAQNGTTAPLDTGRASVTPYYQAQQNQPELPPVKIGLLVPLTGPQGDLGQAMLNAAQMALFDMKASAITLVPRDTTTGAAKAASEAIAEGAQIILGPLFASDVKAVSPVAKTRNIPVIAFSTDWTAATDNTYIMGFLPFNQVARVVDYAAKRGAKRFTAVIPQTPYGIVVSGSMKNEAQNQNVAAQSYLFYNNGGLAQAVTAATQNADAIMLPLTGAQLNQAAAVIQQNRTRTSIILGTGLWDDSAQAGNLLTGAWYAAPDPTLRASFNGKYRTTYGGTPPRLASLAYDATALAAALAIKGETSGGAPAYDRASLTNPSGFAGLDGVFRFRPDGLAERGLAVLELRPNGSAVVDAAPTRF